MAEKNSTGLQLQDELPVDHPVVRKEFRIMIDVEATLSARSHRGALPPADNLPYGRLLVGRLLDQPDLVHRLWLCRAVEVASQAGKVMEDKYGWGGTSEDELLAPVFAGLEPDARAYFTEELEDGASAYYFDGCGAILEQATITEIAPR